MSRELIKGTDGLTLISEVFNFGAQARATQRFTGSLAACKAGAPGFGRRGTGDFTGFAVDSAIPSHQGDTEHAELVINWVWDPTQFNRPPGQDGGFDMPPDRHSLKKVSQDLPVETLYPWNALITPGDGWDPVVAVDPDTFQEYEIISFLKQAAANPGAMWELADRVLGGTSLSTEQRGLAQDLLTFYMAGTTHKRFWYHSYSWQSYHWFLPPMDEGGYCTSAPGGPGSGALPVGYDWLREPDEYDWDGSYWLVTRAWQGIRTGNFTGSPQGWNRKLYPHI